MVDGKDVRVTFVMVVEKGSIGFTQMVDTEGESSETVEVAGSVVSQTGCRSSGSMDRATSQERGRGWLWG